MTVPDCIFVCVIFKTTTSSCLKSSVLSTRNNNVYVCLSGLMVYFILYQRNQSLVLSMPSVIVRTEDILYTKHVVLSTVLK